MLFKLRSGEKVRKDNNVDNIPITTVIGSEIFISGDIKGAQVIKIDGRIRGDVEVEKRIILGEKCFLEGNLKSHSIIIYGKIVGNVESVDLTLMSTGMVDGDITTETLEINKGGRYNGKLTMKERPESTDIGHNAGVHKVSDRKNVKKSIGQSSNK
ncbi:MAG: polymer-forming cytoskeletal protein [Bergeyella sp.]|nr:polymer-forming cytoskeletal protein [Bergeyella sp.]